MVVAEEVVVVGAGARVVVVAATGLPKVAMSLSRPNSSPLSELSLARRSRILSALVPVTTSGIPVRET